MTDAPTKVPLVTAALVAGVILAQELVLTIYGFIVQLTVLPEVFQSAGSPVALAGLLTLVRAVVFGVGVFVSLRFVAPIHGEDLWPKVILRGVIATAIGALALLAYGVVATLVSSINPGADIFGYSFNVQVNVSAAGQRIVDVLGGALDPLVELLPLVVLAAVLQRLWLSRPPKYS
jgi:hypothetical protein